MYYLTVTETEHTCIVWNCFIFVNIEIQVGVRTLNLLTHSTDLQQTKYMLGYVDNNIIDVLPTDLYPCVWMLNSLHMCAHNMLCKFYLKCSPCTWNIDYGEAST